MNENLLFPLVDVVVPVYNGVERLAETLKTINDQTYPNVAVYVIDDCSTDSSGVIAREYPSKFPKQVIRHEKNRGLSAARNTGIQSGVGEFIAILDADDLWCPNKLQKQVNLLSAAKNEVGLVSADFQVIDWHGKLDDGGIYSYCKDIDPEGRSVLVFGNVVSGGSAAMIRRECFEQCGLFDEQLTACEDWEMWFRISSKFSIRIIREPLVFVRRHETSMQGDGVRMAKNRMEMFRRFRRHKPPLLAARSLMFAEMRKAVGIAEAKGKRTREDAFTFLCQTQVFLPDDSQLEWAKAYRNYNRSKHIIRFIEKLDQKLMTVSALRKTSLSRKIKAVFFQCIEYLLKIFRVRE